MAPTITRKRAITPQPEPETENWRLPVGMATVPIQPEQDFDEEDTEETAVDRLAVLLSSAAGADRASLKAYRIENNKMIFCESFAPDAFEEGDFALIRDNFGGGEYELRLYGIRQDGSTNGRFSVLRKLRIHIAEPLKTSPIATAQAASQVDMAGMMQNMMQFQAEQNNRLMEAIAKAGERPQVDPMQQMRDQLSMMTLMREAMGITTQPAQQRSSIAEIVDAIKELKGAASIVAGGGEESESDDTMKMLGSITELVKAGMSNQAAQPAPAVQPALQVPANLQTNPIPTPEPTQEQPDMNPIAAIALKVNFNKLITMAKENKAPEQGAELIYEKMPDEIVDIMETEEWFDILKEFAPEVTPYQDWMTKARDMAMALFNEPEPDSGFDATPSSTS